MNNNVYLASKPRYEVLDGLRGVASIMVIFFHIFETYAHKFGFQIIDHGYLAVDFFFVLSGFVIGYAYDDRWDKMSTWGFFKRRLVRLHPMLVMGTVVGAVFYFFGQCPQFGLEGYADGGKLLLAFVLALFMIPVGSGLDVRGWGEMNPLNGPQWSLTYEYIGNILNGVYNAACILLVFPLIVMMGAGSQLKGEKSTKVCTFLGELSYPIYITHYPILYMQMNWAWNHMDAPVYAHVVVALSSVLISIGVAYAFLKLYDMPVRKWLTEHWLKR